ncbi:MAG: bifunctional nicotinamidase/pyrazinamidase [Acidobacteria bacterium]|nr:bifunctional nicotinamidase/pyrazinamidase [Acidobacteriota bacterium]
MAHAFLVIDVQNDFCPGGALAVPDGHAVVPLINARQAAAELVVLTQDWHPPMHQSFAVNHPDAAPYDVVTMPYGPQVLWPAHCVQGTTGADFHPALDTTRAALVVRKGMHTAIDSYSAFFENDRVTPTGLHGFLRERGVTAMTLTGLALDYCVAYSAEDAARLGYRVHVQASACRAIDLRGSLAEALVRLQACGVTVGA